jgi:hypothetical protein
MGQTKYFKDCVVIAQARVIEGKKTSPHICTIVWDLIDNNFLRITFPFSLKETPLKRWKRFSFLGDKTNIIAGDTREETWGINKSNLFTSYMKLSQTEQKEVHKNILSVYSKYNSEQKLHEDRKSIGILIPKKSSLKVDREISEKEIERKKEMKKDGLFHSKYVYKITGKKYEKNIIFKNKEEKNFEKTLIARDVFEAERQGRDLGFISKSIYDYKNPYIIIGNLPFERRAFVAVGILSAPEKYIEDYGLKTDYQPTLQLI